MAFWHDEDGATAIEYALIGSLVSIVIVVALTTVGSALSATFANVASKVAPT